MTVQHWSNDDSDVVYIAGTTQTNPGSVGFNGALVKTAYECAFTTSEGFRVQFRDDAWGGVPRDSFRFQFAHTHSDNLSNISFGSMSGKWITLADIGNSGLSRFRIKHSATTNRLCNLQRNTSSNPLTEIWVDIGPPVDVAGAYGQHTLTVVIANPGYIQWHYQGALMAQWNGDTTLAGAAPNLDTVIFHSWGNTGLGGVRNTWGELILCDIDFQCFGLHVTNPAINAAGFYNEQVTGVYTDVNEAVKNTATAMTFDTTGQRFTAEVADLDASLITTSIIGVRIGALARHGDTGPMKLKMMQRLASGGDFESPARTINGVGYTPIAYKWLANPFTGLPYTYAEVNAMQIGVRAET